MAASKDPTEPLRQMAAAFPGVARGTSCNQSSFKAGKGSFLFVGPGAKGQGYKAMFKLDRSLEQARELADREPDRFEVGSTGWVTTRFTAEKPLPKKVWEKWLRESYERCLDSEKTPSKKKATATSFTKKKKTPANAAKRSKKKA